MPAKTGNGSVRRNPFGARGRGGFTPYVGFAPGMGLFVLFLFLPAVAIFYFAMTDATGISGLPIHFIGLANFREFFHNSSNYQVIERTLVYAGVVTVVQNSVGLGIAVVLNGRIRYRTFIRTVVFAPVVLGVTVTGLVWELVLDPTAGPVASFLRVFGIHSAFFGSEAIAFWLVIAVQIWMGMGFSVAIFIAGLQTVPPDLLEAAATDGASAGQRFRRVTWPLLAPCVTTNVLIAVIGSVTSYQLVYVLTDGLNNTSVLSFAVFLAGFGQATGTGTVTQTFAEQGYAASVSVVQFVLTAVLAFVVLGYLRRREPTL